MTTRRRRLAGPSCRSPNGVQRNLFTACGRRLLGRHITGFAANEVDLVLVGRRHRERPSGASHPVQEVRSGSLVTLRGDVLDARRKAEATKARARREHVVHEQGRARRGSRGRLETRQRRHRRVLDIRNKGPLPSRVSVDEIVNL